MPQNLSPSVHEADPQAISGLTGQNRPENRDVPTGQPRNAKPVETRCAPRGVTSIAAVVLIPVLCAAGLAWFATDVPLSIDEEAGIISRDGFGPAARLMAPRVGSWGALACIVAGAGGVVAALLALRVAKTRLAALLAGTVATTHAALLLSAADVRGVWNALALTLLGAAGAVLGRTRWRRLAALALGCVGMLCFTTPRGLPDASELLHLALNRPASAPLQALILPLVALAVVAAGMSRRTIGWPGGMVASGAAATLAALGLSTAAQTMVPTIPDRIEARRFLARLDAIPPLASTLGAEIVLDAPASGSVLATARPARSLVAGLDEALEARHIRVFRWAPPQSEGLLSLAPPELIPVIDAEVDDALSLASPAADARLPARSATDEPDFRFSFGDVDPCCLHDVKIVIIAEAAGGSQVIVRALEESTVRREASQLVWRPGWRPMSCAERELRWEDGEVCPRGSQFWWTVAVVTEDGARIAPLRRAFVEP